MISFFWQKFEENTNAEVTEFCSSEAHFGNWSVARNEDGMKVKVSSMKLRLVGQL